MSAVSALSPCVTGKRTDLRRCGLWNEKLQRVAALDYSHSYSALAASSANRPIHSVNWTSQRLFNASKKISSVKTQAQSENLLSNSHGMQKITREWSRISAKVTAVRGWPGKIETVNLFGGNEMTKPFELQLKGRGYELDRYRVVNSAIYVSSRQHGMAAAMPAGAATSAGATEEGSSMAAESDLLIVGPGVLGTLVAKEWMKAYPNSAVVGQTRTTNRHAELEALGIRPTVRDPEDAEPSQFPFVIFCAPPSGSDDYPSEVLMAVKRWRGAESGAFLFTSSSGLYDVEDNGPCTEDSPIVPLGRSPRTDRLIQAEQAALTAGGTVVRLAGLYLLNRGAHTFWLSKGSVEARPDHILNLLHYEDAASLSVAAMKAKARGKIFMGCDNHPVTRQEVMDSTMRSGKFEGEFHGFTGSEGPLGKRMSNERTRAELNWQPKYASFGAFLGVA